MCCVYSTNPFACNLRYSHWVFSFIYLCQSDETLTSNLGVHFCTYNLYTEICVAKKNYIHCKLFKMKDLSPMSSLSARINGIFSHCLAIVFLSVLLFNMITSIIKFCHLYPSVFPTFHVQYCISALLGVYILYFLITFFLVKPLGILFIVYSHQLTE